jgi:hypothetical protein
MRCGRCRRCVHSLALCDAASALSVEAVKAFRHSYSDFTASALAVLALGDPVAGGLGDVAGRLS